MDDELFRRVYRTARELAPRRAKRQQFSDALIVGLYLWAAIRHKPMSWACRPAHSPHALAGGPLPSVSTLSRRLRSDPARSLLGRLEARLHARPHPTRVGCWILDAKPLPVSPYSKDKQARRGWAYNGLARGYKLFALCDLDGRIRAWQVHAMNRAEPTVAPTLLQALERPGYVLADSVYDSVPLHRAAAQRGLQMIAPRKDPTGPIGRRARHGARLHAIDMLETFCNRFGPAMYAQRTRIERAFARLASSRVGLDHLPGWVRGLDRVRRWTQAKLILDAAQHGAPN